MANLNKVLVMGNLTRDPEIKYLPDGTAVTNFSIAINNNYTDKSGEKKEDVVFVEVTAWKKQAEVINEHFIKGDPIFIEGRLKLDRWDDKEGNKRSKLKVVVQNFQFLKQREAGVDV